MIKKILIIGAGPIIIGQACEFDYSGAQACKALKEEGYRVILINSNPATIMTDPNMADATYIEPITPEFVTKIIEKERDDLKSDLKLKESENCEPVKINKIQIHPNTIRATAIPPSNVPDRNIFCYAALSDKQQGTLYTDAMGALPARSMDANQYYFIAYDYDTN